MKIILLLFILASFTTLSQITLDWEILHEDTLIHLGEKGSVQEAFIQAELLPDPFYGKNEELFSWMEDREWTFISSFELKKKSSFIELEFPSIDTYAKVYVNDSLVLLTDNAFIPHRVQIENVAKIGINKVRVEFTPPILYHKDRFVKESFHYPAPNDVGKIAVAPYTRKPQYQFGWDWALRMNTMGLNKKVKVHLYNQNRLINHSIRTIHLEKRGAEVELKAFFAGAKNEELVWKSKLFGNEKVTLKNGVASRIVRIENPELWWPNGQGEAYLYNDNWLFRSVDNEVIESFDLKFGVKTSELIQEEDEWGISYYFKINGRRVFGKGADYIPQDIFPARVKEEDVEKMVETMSATNFNMVRVWGGGYYPEEVFFEKCDELGIMVWQDLMFACAMYPGDSVFLNNVEKELEYQIPRISSHPSVILFNGNNEVEVAWKNWGFQSTYELKAAAISEIETAYVALFKKLAPETILRFANTPYIHTSPLSNWGKDEFLRNGSQHYWGVWHGKDPMEDFSNKIGRFNAEYGFQSFPEYSTLSSFSEEKEWNLDSDVMKFHQKSYVGNNMMLKHAIRLYGEPKNFQEFVYFSQLTQAKAIEMAISGHRVDSPRCGGTLYWQLNDCWPAPTWSSIDYYGNWKALHYKVKENYQSIAMVRKYIDLDHSDFYFVSDNVLPQNVNYTIRAYSPDGVLLKIMVFVKSVSLMKNAYLFSLEELKKKLKTNQLVLVAKYEVDEEEFTQTIDCISENHYEKAPKESIQYSLEIENGEQYLKIHTQNTVRDLWISSSKGGVYFEQNFVTLLPGSYSIKIKAEYQLTRENLKLMWR